MYDTYIHTYNLGKIVGESTGGAIHAHTSDEVLAGYFLFFYFL